jgi:hypothetical protein
MHPTAKPAEDLFHCKSPVENVISSFSGYFREENQPLNQEQREQAAAHQKPCLQVNMT